ESLITALHHGEGFAKQSSAMVRDLSLCRARMQAKMLPVMNGAEIQLKTQVAVSGVESIINLNAIARSVTKEASLVDLEVKFVSMSDSDRITLHGYVLSNIYKQN